jgi:hypothetical protein
MYSGGMQRSASLARFSKTSCSASAVECWNERIACPAFVERECEQVAISIAQKGCALLEQDGGVLLAKQR